MADETDALEDLASSDQAADNDAEQFNELSDNAVSSPAADESPKDTLSVVRDVVAATQQGAASAPGSSPEGDAEKVEAGGVKPADDENYTDVPFHKHPRFQRLLQDKKAAEVDAVQYRNVQGFLDRSNLSSEEAANALITAGLAKTDPVKAWEQIKPWAEKIAIAAGVIMPDDLKEQVQSGQMTREAAVELSKARAQVHTLQGREQLQQQQAQTRAQTEARQAIIGAATSWETDRQAKDPNFGAKVPALQRELAYLHATEGRPNTPQGVKEQCQRAYEAVNKAFVAPQPAIQQPQRKPAVRPVTGGQVAGNAAKAPESTLDIIRAHRARG